MLKTTYKRQHTKELAELGIKGLAVDKELAGIKGLAEHDVKGLSELDIKGLAVVKDLRKALEGFEGEFDKVLEQ